jgi:hypothetical protein
MLIQASGLVSWVVWRSGQWLCDYSRFLPTSSVRALRLHSFKCFSSPSTWHTARFFIRCICKENEMENKVWV